MIKKQIDYIVHSGFMYFDFFKIKSVKIVGSNN